MGPRRIKIGDIHPMHLLEPYGFCRQTGCCDQRPPIVRHDPRVISYMIAQV